MFAGSAVWEPALLDSIQCVGSGLCSDGVLGGSLLLPSAASDRNHHTGVHVLHQKGCLKHESYNYHFIFLNAVINVAVLNDE